MVRCSRSVKSRLSAIDAISDATSYDSCPNFENISVHPLRRPFFWIASADSALKRSSSFLLLSRFTYSFADCFFPVRPLFFETRAESRKNRAIAISIGRLRPPAVSPKKGTYVTYSALAEFAISESESTPAYTRLLTQLGQRIHEEPDMFTDLI